MESKKHKKSFSQFQIKQDNLRSLIKEEAENEILSQNNLLRVINHDDINEDLNYFIFKENNKLNPNPVISNIQSIDFGKTRYVANDSNFIFYQKFHNHNSMKRKGILNQNTPSTQFIEECKSQKIIPNPIGLLKRQGSENDLNLNKFRVGDSYVKALSESLKFSDHVNEIHLGANRLTSVSINPLLLSLKENEKLFRKLEVLDLSYNFLSRDCVQNLCVFLSDNSCVLKELNLEGNNLGDSSIIKICDEIVNKLNYKIKVLNFGKNMISDKAALSLSQIAQFCMNLRILIIFWNDIHNFGASQIISKLKNHSELRIFDISWNSIGNNLLSSSELKEKKIERNESKEPKKKEKIDIKKVVKIELLNREVYQAISNFSSPNKKLIKSVLPSIDSKGLSLFAKELGEYFNSKDVKLTHLDISHNNLNYTDSLHISNEVKANHTILGIHVDGNDMRIDELGFISAINKNDKNENFFANSQIHYQINKENHIKSKLEHIRKIRAKNNCWICEGWRQVEFVYKLSNEIKQIVSTPLDVNIHFGFESWKPNEMFQRNNKWYCYRMCPPGETLYFISVNTIIEENETILGDRALVLTKPFNYNFEVVEEDEDIGEIKRTIPRAVRKINSRKIEINKQVVDKENNKTFSICLPRPEKILIQNIRIRTPWDFKLSIWFAYEYQREGDSEDYIDKCFENDFERINKNRDGKIDENLVECRNILRESYRKLIDTYKFLASQFGSNIWQIGLITLQEFSQKCPGLLDLEYDINSVFLQEKSSKALDRGKKNKNIPDNLIRHQFMNLLIKVAKDKYIRTKKLSTVKEALKLSLDRHFLPAMNEYEHHTWRLNRYYNESVDNFLKAFLPYFDAIYRSWAPRKDPGRRDTWMILSEFSDLVLSFTDSDFPNRDIPLIYNYSVRLQINEVDFDRHFNMLFYEFLEAFCRVVDRASPPPIDSVKEEWSMEKRESQLLIAKLENYLSLYPRLIKDPNFRSVKEKFVVPVKDPETFLYKFDSSSSYYSNLSVPRGIYYSGERKKTMIGKASVFGFK